MNIAARPMFDCHCGGAQYQTAFVYNSPPSTEIRLPLNGSYYREYRRCTTCGHFLSVHNLDFSGLYNRIYVDTVYGSSDGIRKTFERIIALPADRSDNRARVERVSRFGKEYLKPEGCPPRLIDIGSGLCVFAYGMREVGWECTALDPDPRAVEHARSVVQVCGLQGDFTTIDLVELGHYHAVTFNKVLEHVTNPVSMLRRARIIVRGGGFVYVEVPDVAAAIDGPDREEFTIDHHHVFSPASLAILADRAGFELLKHERLREPSGKYTLCGFMKPC
jgi:SAM-dependent methyltransferase